MHKTVSVLAAAVSIFVATEATLAQEKQRVWRIGTLFSGSPKTHGHFVDMLRQGFRDLDYVEGKTHTIVSRWAMGKREKQLSLARELVDQKVDVIVVNGLSSIRAVQRATKTIPIVVGATATLFKYVGKPAIQRGNIVGSTFNNYALGTKRVALLKTVVPEARHIVYLMHAAAKRIPTTMKGSESAAKALGIDFQKVRVKTVDELEGTFASLAARGVDGVILNNHRSFNFHRKRIATLAVTRKLPLICERATFAQAGCLLGYSADRKHMMRRAVYFIDKILKGAKAADLPVAVATHYDLSLNLKTAKALGIALPPSILLQATQVIE